MQSVLDQKWPSGMYPLSAHILPAGVLLSSKWALALPGTLAVLASAYGHKPWPQKHTNISEFCPTEPFCDPMTPCQGSRPCTFHRTKQHMPIISVLKINLWYFVGWLELSEDEVGKQIKGSPNSGVFDGIQFNQAETQAMGSLESLWLDILQTAWKSQPTVGQTWALGHEPCISHNCYISS